MARLFLTCSLMVAASAAPRAQPVEPYPERLQLVGALHCLTSRVESAATTKLACTLRLHDVAVEQGSFEGVMYGDGGLYLVAPGNVRVLWNVLAPTPLLPPEAVEGEYDTASKHKFAYARESPNLLIDGMGDLVALELVAPRIDPIGSDTRLALRRSS